MSIDSDLDNTPMNTTADLTAGASLDNAQYLADPLADQTIARILGPWQSVSPDANAEQLMQAHAPHWEKLARISSQFKTWDSNAALKNWTPGTGLPPEIGAELQAYLAAGSGLPEWADLGKIKRAEELFFKYGALSCTLLFCASLPECYVVPDLSAVLHAAGQLEDHTEHRIRSTAAMIFPVMLKGGLTAPDGAGVAQVLKVRLIHATIRNLILRASPEAAMQILGNGQHHADAGIVPPLASLPGQGNLYQALFAHGWKIGKDGLPCNQEELAYTLLTFGYVFLRSLRHLGVGFTASDELAYLHTWNVVGHVLGIRRELMADTMDEAATLFASMQARGRAQPVTPDPRPALGAALMKAMRDSIPLPIVKSFPVLMTRYLCGAATAQDIGVANTASPISRFLFAFLMGVVRCIDSVVRLVVREFSLASLLTRLVGYSLLTRLLLDQTRPLNLPERLLNNINDTVSAWSGKKPG
jgi:hypothetical protein